MNKRRGSRPQSPSELRVSPKYAAGFTEYRRAELESEVGAGIIREGKNYNGSSLNKAPPVIQNASADSDSLIRSEWRTSNGGKVINGDSDNAIGAIANSHSYRMKMASLEKDASVLSGVGSVGAAGSSTGAYFDRLSPEIYSPLFTMANLNLPRDRITINAWCRNFFQLHPIVRNAITLHATYPISKLNLKCEDKKVLQFFENMVEEMDLLNSLGEISLEWWKIGETFPFAELNENEGKWSRIIIQNPDFVNIKKSVLSGEPIISLRPDETLKRLVFSNNPSDIQIRKQIPENIIHFIRKGQDIPLDNFNVSHLKMLSSPYDIRGTSVIVSVFKDLMLYDKLRECYSEDTEFLTENGFKRYEDISDDEKLGTFNPKTEMLEYQNSIGRTQYYYDGEMYHFNGQKLDILVTPNHRMWLSKDTKNDFGEYGFVYAKDVKNGCYYKTRATAKWKGKNIKVVKVGNSKVPADRYMKILGHIISEGCIHYNEEKSNYSLTLSQKINSSSYISISQSLHELSTYCNIYCGNKKVIKTRGFSKNSEMEEWRITRKFIVKHFANEIGTNSHNKRIPNWIKKLSPRLLNILLEALAEGDAHIDYNLNGRSFRYSTISEQLADDVCEIAFKAGYAPIKFEDYNGDGKRYFAVSWSETNYGKTPFFYGNKKNGNGGGGTFNKIMYSGNVSCFQVPNELLITRRNGKISIQGNSKFAQADSMINPVTLIKVGGNSDGEYRATQQDLEYYKNIFEEAEYDKNAKIVTHSGVMLERSGYQGHVLDIAGDLEFITKNIYTGLMVPPAVVDTESAVYSSASIGLEVLRQRYFNFRNMIARWLVNKIFAPISEIQGFYQYKNKEKHLIVPEVEWNQMNLYDLDNYISNITGMVSAGQASVQTLYKSMGLNYEEERVKIRKEDIDKAIRMREQNALTSMSLSELRTLDPEKPVEDPVDSKEREKSPQEGEVPGGIPGMPDMGGGDMGIPGGMPELAPPSEMSMPGAGAPEGGGVTPPLGPGGGV